MRTLVKKSRFSEEKIIAVLKQLVDVVVQCGIEGRKRVVKEIWLKSANLRCTTTYGTDSPA